MNSLAKRDVETIAEEVSVQLDFLPEEYRYIPDGSDLDECIEYARKIAVFVHGVEMEGKYIWGKMFKNIKKKLGHGKWLETCALLNIHRRDAERCMKIAEGFEHDPSQLKGLTQQKALHIASLPEDQHQTFVDHQVLYDMYGNPYPFSEFQKMAWKDFQSKERELKKEKNEWKDRALTNEHENRTMHKDMEDKEAYIRELEKDADPAVLDKLERIKQLKVNYEQEVAALKELMVERKKEEYEGEEAFGNIAKARGCFMEGVALLGNIRLTDDYDPELKAEYYSAIGYARTILDNAEDRAKQFFGLPPLRYVNAKAFEELG